ncbi:uncharacterized protein LOC123894995 [Trifolium pratense]|uniref:uncharacterized protein LOC123894995 n=1 Tax=Trifolium pratense TaxID=57577 RepID=UPI001E690A2E|nr:uncharacterized protein LOC123894995 [Trifolium pratense]
MATFEELSSEEKVEEEEEANLALMASTDSDVDSDDEPESDSEVADEVFSDCSKTQLIIALNKVIEKHLKVLSKQKLLQEKLNTLNAQESHFQGLYQQTLDRVTDLEKGCAICHKPSDEQEKALKQFVHLNIGKSKAANLVYNVMRHHGEGVGYEYGRTYSKLKTFAKRVGKSLVYYVVPQSEEGKNFGTLRDETVDLKVYEADGSEEPSSSGSGKRSSEDRGCLELENVKPDDLNTSKSDASTSGIKETSVPKVNQPKNLKFFKRKEPSLKPQKQYKTQIIYDSRIRRYNQSNHWIDLASRKGYVLPKMWKQVRLKGKKAYVLDIWLTSPQLTTQGGIMNHSWYLDSGCSRHMTGEKQLFSKLTLKEGGSVGFGGNQKGKIIGTVVFGKESCTVSKQSDKSIVFKGLRKNNVYKINLSDLNEQKVVCLLTLSEEKWIWHKRLGHAN